jgi:tetratricopeptide (TPR) repeat protein
MGRRSELFSVACLFLALTATANAQHPTGPNVGGVATATSNIPVNGTGGGARVTLSVVDDKMGRLGHPAMVKLFDENIKSASWQPISKNSEATFEDLALGKYDLDVTAIGYLPSRKEIEISNARQPVHLQVVLLRDPDAVELSGADPSMPAKASKEADHGVTDLESGKYPDAQKHLESAYKQAPSNAHANFLLGYLYFQQNDFDKAQTYLTQATTLDPHDMQAINLSGRVHLARRDYAGAKTILEQAIAVNPDNATAHGLLADADLNLSDFKDALAQADLSIEKSKSNVSSAHVVRGEALANLGRDDEAIQTLKDFLQNAPDSASGPQVRQFMAAIEARHPDASSTTAQPQKQ